jgi:hypothetical protein
MKDWLFSLSIGSGALFTAVCSIILGLPFCFVRQKRFRWSGIIVLPLSLAFCLYWIPAWLGENSPDFSVWSWLFIGLWSLAGLVSLSLFVLIIRKFFAK